MSTQRDYYDVLGVSKGAGVDEVKKAYRKLVMQHHPDRVSEDKKKEAEAKFKEISESYAVLSDPKKKQLYDQYGHSGIDSRYSTEDIFKSADFSDFFGGSFGSVFEDLFSGAGADIFGGRARSRTRAKRKGEDIEYQLSITLEEAGKGIEKEVTFHRYDICSKCQGGGAEPGSSKEICRTCRGQGSVTSGMGFINFSQTCPACHGEGRIVKNRCRACLGQGRVKVSKNIKVNVPAGVDTGSVLRLRSEGNDGPGGRGELYLHIYVKSHNVFRRQGSDLTCKVKISIYKAILGSEIEVPTLSGKVKMKVPPGTQPNTIFRLKGKGMMDLHTHRPGDEMIEVDVEVPTRLSSREKNMIQELAKMRRE